MTSPSPYEQYPRPSVPAGPSSWEQPAFAEESQPQASPLPTFAPPPAQSGLAAFRRDLLPSQKSSGRSIRFYSRVSLASAMLTVLLVLVGVTTQVAFFFGLAVAAGIGAAVGVLLTLKAILQLLERRAGPHEDNG